jgi:hypothetical protein
MSPPAPSFHWQQSFWRKDHRVEHTENQAPDSEPEAPDPQQDADRRMTLLALDEERQRYALAKLHWHMAAEGIPSGSGSHMRSHEKNIRDHRRTIAKLEELLEQGLPGPSESGIVVAFPVPDEDGDAS